MVGILFVDDEPRILQGLRMSLRAKRKVWNMCFEEGGAAALARLEQTSVDVIVSDMRMPGMDGATLLGRVAQLYPRTTRIVLSGQTDETAAVRAAGVAHWFLAKPCQPNLLEEGITRTTELRDRLSPEVQRTVSGLQRLPVLSARVRSLTEAVADTNVSVSAIADIVERDLGMAAKTLQIVSSSFFGPPGNPSTVARAVDYLGVGTLRSLLDSNVFASDMDATVVHFVAEEQERARLCARIAEEIVPKDTRLGRAAAAALLHNIGAVALATTMPEAHRAARAEARERQLPISLVERERFGASHAEVGAYLLSLWGLPDDVVSAVLTHHEPLPPSPSFDVSTFVRIANTLAAELGGRRPATEPSLLVVMESLGIADRMERIRERFSPKKA